jgi:hypothetical protein
MRSVKRFTFAAVVSLSSLTAAAQTGPWDIAVDVGRADQAPVVTPAKPIARIGEDDVVTLQILSKGEIPSESLTSLQFGHPVLTITRSAKGVTTLTAVTVPGVAARFAMEGTSHMLRFRNCSDKTLHGLRWADGRPVMRSDCPIVANDGTRTVTVYANTDAIPLIAAVTDAKNPGEVRTTAFTIRTVRPYWNLNWSTGFSFFSGQKVRDERYALRPFQDDPLTTTDESATTDQEIVRLDRGETPYEFGAFATYMLHRPVQLPLGITFGVSTEIPVDQLTAVAGLSTRIKAFPIADSAFLTAGIAYRSASHLMPKYRGTMRAPEGVAESDIVESRHDVGFFLAVSFGFGGGDAQFKKVVAGQ